MGMEKYGVVQDEKEKTAQKKQKERVKGYMAKDEEGESKSDKDK